MDFIDMTKLPFGWRVRRAWRGSGR